MRKLVHAIYVSLDGVVAEPAWTGPFFNDELAALQHQLLFASDALVLGRVTYEGFAAAWPTMTHEGDFAVRMNTMPKHVASRTLTTTTWNAELLPDDPVAAVEQHQRFAIAALVVPSPHLCQLDGCHGRVSSRLIEGR